MQPSTPEKRSLFSVRISFVSKLHEVILEQGLTQIFSFMCSTLSVLGAQQMRTMASLPTHCHLSVAKGKFISWCLCKVAGWLLLTSNQCFFIWFVFFLCSQKLLRSPRKQTRKISKIPFKVLDAPELQDDFYLNLVDWSALNVLSVGLGTCVYLWSACTSQVLLV